MPTGKQTNKQANATENNLLGGGNKAGTAAVGVFKYLVKILKNEGLVSEL